MRSLLVCACVLLLVGGCRDAAPSPADSATQVAQRLGLSLEEVRRLGTERSLAPEELLRMPREKLERARRKLSTPKPDHPGEWAAWRASFWKDEFGRVPANALETARQQFAQLAPQNLLGGGGLNALDWTEIGPGNIGGRVRAIAPHPTISGRLFCGGVSGGLWRSDNDGQSWTAIDDFLANLAITCIVFDPTDASVLYAGTGEGYFNQDAIRGLGIFKSVDGGTSWSQLAATANSDFHYVNRLSIAPDGSAILAATGRGLSRSTDGGASWTTVKSGTSSRGEDVDFHPANPMLAVASYREVDFSAGGTVRSIQFSTDGGQTWTQSAGINLFNAMGQPTGSRSETAWHAGWTGGGNGCVYVLRNEGNGTLYRSLDGGASFTLVSNPASPSLLGNLGWYANALWIDPSDQNANVGDDFVLVGGLDIFKSTDGGQSFSKISQWFSWPQSAHADHHVIVESPGFDGVSDKKLYFGNDGGVWRADDYTTVDLTSGWISLNSGLGITQFYGASGHAGTGMIVGGTQDNGTLRYLPASGANAWLQTFGGDGGYCAVDPTDPNYYYGEYVYLRMHRSSTGGFTSEWISGEGGSVNGWNPAPYLIPDARDGFANFIAPFVLDPNEPNRILAGGRSLWRTNDARTPNGTDIGPSWASIKAPAGTSNISAIAVADGNADIIWVGHNNGHLFRTLNGTATTPTWTRVDQTSPSLPNRRITRITIDPVNHDHVLITESGFSINNLWQTTNAGTSWTPATGLPAIPLRDVELHPTLPGVLYVASEMGLLVSEDDGVSWSSTLYGPANVSVDELFWLDDELYAVTHGRGIFRQEPMPGPSALLACAAGNVGLETGTVSDVLFVNGSAGGTDRRVDVALGQSITISVAQPPSLTGPAPFILWGRLGVPDAMDQTPLPAGIGTMCFPPCLLFPGDPTLFTLASSFPGDPCGSLFPATPPPWSVTLPAAVPLPIAFTLQGVILGHPTLLRVTNGVILNLR